MRQKPSPEHHQSRRLGIVAGGVGLLGSLTCIGTMLLAIAGIGAAAGMAGMRAGDPRHASGVLGALLNAGPAILVVSTVAIAVAFAIRRSIAVLPALAGGALLYWGMYGQGDLMVMYGAIVAGLAIWVATYWRLRAHWRSPNRAVAARESSASP